LGCSGGPDSLALLHLLIQFPIKLHVAHVDHGWREESSREAEALAAHVGELKLPFHLLTLSPGQADSELKAREARFEYFAELVQKWDCQALVLGHQADDQAETVLKRVLEGAGLAALGGIRPVSTRSGIPIWRPLLGIQKQEILKWLEEKKLEGFDDPTNADPKYLRSRMRAQILPGLEQAFGKAISSNLVRLGDLAHEVREYLMRKSALFSLDLTGPAIDLNPYYPLDPFELKLFLKHLSTEEKIFLSHQEIDLLQSLIEENGVNKLVKSIKVSNRCLVLLKNRN
jgi:tRNA(Ile)-lysidine synthase